MVPLYKQQAYKFLSLAAKFMSSGRVLAIRASCCYSTLTRATKAGPNGLGMKPPLIGPDLHAPTLRLLLLSFSLSNTTSVGPIF